MDLHLPYPLQKSRKGRGRYTRSDHAVTPMP